MYLLCYLYDLAIVPSAIFGLFIVLCMAEIQLRLSVMFCSTDQKVMSLNPLKSIIKLPVFASEPGFLTLSFSDPNMDRLLKNKSALRKETLMSM